MWHLPYRVVLIGLALTGTATAEVPMVGHVAAARTVLEAIRAAELEHALQGRATLPHLNALPTPPSVEDCRLAGLDGWDQHHVNSLWQCADGRSDYRLFVLNNGTIALQN